MDYAYQFASDEVYTLVNMQIGFGSATAFLGAVAVVATAIRASRCGLYHIYLTSALAGLFYLIKGGMQAGVGGSLLSILNGNFDEGSVVQLNYAYEFFLAATVPISWIPLFAIYQKISSSPETQGFKGLLNVKMLCITLSYLWALIIIVSDIGALGTLSNTKEYTYGTYESLLTAARAIQFAAFGTWMFPFLAAIQAYISFDKVRHIFVSLATYQFLLLIVVIGRTISGTATSGSVKVYLTFLFLLIDVAGVAAIFVAVKYGTTWIKDTISSENHLSNVTETEIESQPMEEIK
ncbi:hypothetical protein J3Q64DRAFT_1733819 [Phycomyces blakesleeanus]|uniref:Uncharacterized protein n=2 Tax=Phycomyces blakesleeanus TaxID=4837 RepID=A0A162TLZ3_PHYB8|nr:hypothetical protein PHYBLDRAFT_172219 [Phycomyces blakesleeanus NRRL 1555(-)]OAD69582.1 hypothetical protein PHYBLDRAFT_172219 [Phycomyces blakesleeanus NRRL 1555(-)]|eukprot:XP_018287622.1 hypothetical protein PHYBLDRAFT_172219 [Phycomyces blakesleeanus NRRL 1555(-)]